MESSGTELPEFSHFDVAPHGIPIRVDIPKDGVYVGRVLESELLNPNKEPVNSVFYHVKILTVECECEPSLTVYDIPRLRCPIDEQEIVSIGNVLVINVFLMSQRMVLTPLSEIKQSLNMIKEVQGALF